MAGAQFSSLPKEMWLEFLHYIPLKLLIGVDRFFLELWMNQRWQEVVIAARLPSKVERVYERLRDPYVGDRVKRLKIELSQCSEEDTGRQTPRFVRQPSSDTLNFKNFTSKFTDGLSLKKRKGKETPPPSPNAHDPFLEGLNSIIQSINFLPNVVELSLEVWNRPDRLTWDILRLFNAIWGLASFGPYLTHLSIDSDLEGYRILVEDCKPSFKDFRALKELDITLINNFNAPDRTKDPDVSLNTVTILIESLARNLEVITLRGIASCPYTPFVTYLASIPFPNLISCSLEFQHPNFPDPKAVKLLLSGLSPILRKLGMRIRLMNEPLDDDLDLKFSEQPLGEWLAACLSTHLRGGMVSFPRLQEIDISPSHTDDGLAVLSSYIHSTSSTLEYLTLRDCYFSPQELRKVMAAASLCKQLKYLKMCVSKLRTESLDPLFMSLPDLEGLWLNVGDVAGSDFEFSYQYRTSKLKDLSLCDKDGLALESRLLKEFGAAVPSVTSFFNLGHKDIGEMKGKPPPSPPRVRR